MIRPQERFVSLIQPATDASFQRFLAALEATCRTQGVRLDLSATPTVPYGPEAVPVSGYFVDHPIPTLAVATGKPVPDWQRILAHESCHLDQWLEHDPVWAGNVMADGLEAVDWLHAWCTHTRELTATEVAIAVRRAQEVELDCERRVLAKIQTFGLAIDAATHVQKANAYVQFYAHLGRTRAWYPPGQAPHQVEAVWREAPTVFLELNQACDRLNQAFQRHYPPAPIADR
jgi:hypothetical protein